MGMNQVVFSEGRISGSGSIGKDKVRNREGKEIVAIITLGFICHGEYRGDIFSVLIQSG